MTLPMVRLLKLYKEVKSGNSRVLEFVKSVRGARIDKSGTMRLTEEEQLIPEFNVIYDTGRTVGNAERPQPNWRAVDDYNQQYRVVHVAEGKYRTDRLYLEHAPDPLKIPE